MPSAALDIYRAASLARWREHGPTQRAEVERPGLCGLLDSDDDPGVTLLVTDDRSYDALAEIVAVAQAGMIQIFPAARRCHALLAQSRGWLGSPSTAMVCRTLPAAGDVPLPPGLRLRPIRRTEDDPAGDVPLEDAIACVVRAAPREDSGPLAAFLQSRLATRLFAAVDAHGTVRATSGYELTGDHARVLLIDTDPAWQRQGLGRAMTRAALLDAARHGAREASLDASERGISVYSRLGFESVGTTVRYRLA